MSQPITISEFLFQEQPISLFTIEVHSTDFSDGTLVVTVHPEGEPGKAMEFIVVGKSFNPVTDGKEETI